MRCQIVTLQRIRNCVSSRLVQSRGCVPLWCNITRSCSSFRIPWPGLKESPLAPYVLPCRSKDELSCILRIKLGRVGLYEPRQQPLQQPLVFRSSCLDEEAGPNSSGKPCTAFCPRCQAAVALQGAHHRSGALSLHAGTRLKCFSASAQRHIARRTAAGCRKKSTCKEGGSDLLGEYDRQAIRNKDSWSLRLVITVQQVPTGHEREMPHRLASPFFPGLAKEECMRMLAKRSRLSYGDVASSEVSGHAGLQYTTSTR